MGLKLVNVLKFALTIIILCSLEVSLSRYIEIFGIAPNIVLAFVVSAAIICGPITGGIIGLVCGIFTDALSSGLTVLNSITYMYIGALCGIAVINYLRKNAAVGMLFTFLSLIIYEEIAHFLHFTIWNASGLFSGFIYPILPAAVYSAVVSVPIFFLTKALFSKQTGREYIR